MSMGVCHIRLKCVSSRNKLVAFFRIMVCKADGLKSSEIHSILLDFTYIHIYMYMFANIYIYICIYLHDIFLRYMFVCDTLLQSAR